MVFVAFMWAWKPEEQGQQVHELIVPTDGPSVCFLSVKMDSSPRTKCTHLDFGVKNNKTAKRRSAVEQEPRTMSDAAIVASIIARQLL
jgi:hypothetical protein